MSQRTICVVTATRAEYGLLRPVIRRLAADAGLRLQLAVTGAHLCARLGSTVREIEADGVAHRGAAAGLFGGGRRAGSPDHRPHADRF